MAKKIRWWWWMEIICTNEHERILSFFAYIMTCVHSQVVVFFADANNKKRGKLGKWVIQDFDWLSKFSFPSRHKNWMFLIFTVLYVLWAHVSLWWTKLEKRLKDVAHFLFKFHKWAIVIDKWNGSMRANIKAFSFLFWFSLYRINCILILMCIYRYRTYMFSFSYISRGSYSGLL